MPNMSFRVVTQTTDILVLRARPTGTLILIGLVIALTTGFGALALHQGRTEQGAGLLAFGIFIGAPLMAYFASSTRATFDRTGGVTTIATRRLWGTTQQSIPLPQITGVTLQEKSRNRTSQNGGNHRYTVYRPALTVSDGTPRPLTPGYSTKGRAQDTVRTITAWLDSNAPQA